MNTAKSRMGLVVVWMLASPLLLHAEDPQPDGVPAGYRLIEGDVIVPIAGPRTAYATNLWPGGVVPYAFDVNVSPANQVAARAAMDMWEARADVSFIPRTTETDSVHIRNSTTNSSFVGIIGGPQNLNIASWGNAIIICHELAHALGVWHEHTRADRDDYIIVNNGNIQAGFQFTFDIRPNGGDFGPYDFESIMHYDECAFSNCCATSCIVCTGCETIEVLPQYEPFADDIGNRSYISLGDAQGMGFLYGFSDPDCNQNHVRDSIDLANGALDCDGNLVPDECDPDCNGNGTPDACDINQGNSQDNNNNMVPDECDGIPPILHVDVSATGANDGSSWTDAFTSLRTANAFAAIAPGVVEEIWVAEGTYRPAPAGGTRLSPFILVNDVAFYGGFQGNELVRDDRDPVAHPTILSGDLNGDDGPGFTNRSDNSANVVVSNSDANETAILDGFTVCGGSADGATPQTPVTGGGLNAGGSPTIRNCIFKDNSGDILQGAGGGVFVMFDAPTLINCTIIGNRAAVGGGVYNYFGSPLLVGCTIVENSTTSHWGGGMVTQIGYPILVNCTFADNSASNSNGGGYVHIGGALPAGVSVMKNCIAWNNSDSGPIDESAQVYNDGFGLILIDSCNIQGWTGAFGGQRNFGADPLFFDAANDDYRLSAGSPCIDSGDNTEVPLDTSDIDHDGDTAERLPQDGGGLARFVDDPATLDTGVPDGLNDAVDMGAHEYQVAAICGLPGDVNVDLRVNGLDIQNFVECLVAGNTNGNCACADIDGLNGADINDVGQFVGLLLLP